MSEKQTKTTVKKTGTTTKKTTTVKKSTTTTKRKTSAQKALELQQQIDYAKWFDSEREHQDMCGTYDFCKYCNKELENPCAKAVEAISKALNETAYVSKKA